jgi:hypothetical protein
MSESAERVSLGPRRIAGALMLMCVLQAPWTTAGAASPDADFQLKLRESAIAAMSGFWEGVMTPEGERFYKLGPNGGPNLGEWTGLYYTPEGLAKAKAWNPDQEYLPENAGRSQVVPTIMTTPFPIKIEFSPSKVTIRLTECDNVRTVAMTGSGQASKTASEPPSKPATAMGVSVGHWEGDTLVIRTTGIRAGFVRANGAPQSPNAIATERLGVLGGYLVDYITLEDPTYYKMPITRVVGFRKRDDLKALDEYGACK